MRWIFQPLSDGGGADRDDDDATAPGLLGLPAALLERHGGRVLDPARAGVVDGYPDPGPTVYRARTLLVPGDLLRDDDFIATLNEVLAVAGMTLVVPRREDRDADLDTDRGDRQVFEALAALPRPAVLVPSPGYRLPVNLDAWTALQTLRAATARGNPDEASRAPEQRISTRRRSIASSWSICWSARPSPGARSTNGPAGSRAGPGNGGDVTGRAPPTPTCSAAATRALRSRWSSIRPRRRPAAECRARLRAAPGDRRAGHRGAGPSVAGRDGVIRAAATPLAADGFVAVDDAIQDAIRRTGERARGEDGDRPRAR